jgi:hypothetical protein
MLRIILRLASMLMEQQARSGSLRPGLRSLDADGGTPSSTDAPSLPLPNMLFLSVVLDHALVNRQEPAIGALYHRVRLLVADEPQLRWTYCVFWRGSSFGLT